MRITPSQKAAMHDSSTARKQTGLLNQVILASACLTLLAAGAARGQEEPAGPVIVEVAPAAAPTTTAPADGPTTMPASAPATMPATQPATMPAAAPTSAPAPEGPVFLDGTTLPNGQLLLNFQNAPLRSVLEYLSKATGLIVVGEPVLEGRVTVISRTPITLPEAILLLDTVLRQKGYAAVYTGRNLKVVTLGQAPRENLEVRFGNDPNKIPETDRIITQVIPVRFVDATKLKADLTAMVPAAATMAANQASNSLIYTDTQANIRRILKVISALDGQMGSEATVKVYKLQYADATTTAKLLTDLFKEDTSAQQSGRSGFPFSFGSFGRSSDHGGGGDSRGGGGGGSGGTSSTSGSGGGRQAKVTATADTRTNNLVVSASPETLKVIDGIVDELEKDNNTDVAVFIYKLKNAQALNVEAVVNNVFGATGTSSRGGTSSGTSSYGRGTTSGGTSPFGGSSSGRGSSSGSFGRSSSSSSPFGSSSSSPFGSSSSSPFGSSSRGFGSSSSSGYPSSGRSSYGGSPSVGPLGANAGDLAGQVFVVADADTNSLLVRTASKNFERVKAILEELDRPTRQVLIKVLLAEVTHDDTTDLGVEFSALNIRIGSSKSSIGTDFGVGTAEGGLIAKVVDVDYTATLRALQSVGRLNVLSRPYILASDNQEASITVGSVVPFITSSYIAAETGSTINTIQYSDIGIILYVIPHINPEGLVIMDVAPEISTLTGKTVPISETVNAPVFAKRSAQTRIAIHNGQTIVIGGLMEDRITDTIEKVPGLGDIPGIGALFRRTIKTKSKTELLIFLTPHVAAVPEQLKEMSKEEKEGIKEFNKEDNKPALDEQLKGMKLGATTMPADPTTMPTIMISDPKNPPAGTPARDRGQGPWGGPARPAAPPQGDFNPGHSHGGGGGDGGE